MALQYLLDGYNIIHKIPQLAAKKLEQAREEFIKMIECHQPQGSSRNQVTIIFDGQPGILGKTQERCIKVFFSEYESADEDIKKRVDQAKNKKSIVVVTDDREIQYYVRALGAKVLSADDFVKRLNALISSKRKRPIQQPQEISGKRIPKTLEQEITSEFERIWLPQGDA